MATIDVTAKNLPPAIASYVENGSLEVSKSLVAALQKARAAELKLVEFRDIPASWLRVEGAPEARWKQFFELFNDTELRGSVADAIKLSEAYLKIDPERTKVFLFESNIFYYNGKREEGMPAILPQFVESAREHVLGALVALRKVEGYYEVVKAPDREDAMDAVGDLINHVVNTAGDLHSASYRLEAISHGMYYLNWFTGF